MPIAVGLSWLIVEGLTAIHPAVATAELFHDNLHLTAGALET
jgi:hypothetical protein